MGLLDTVLSVLKGGPANNAASRTNAAATGNSLLGSVIGLVTDPQTGGLNGLIEKISAGGLGEQVASWISTGQNIPISAEQIQAVLGSSFLQEMAQKAGVNTNEAAGTLATLLPQFIDKLTPEGQVPGDNKLPELELAGLTNLLGNKTA